MCIKSIWLRTALKYQPGFWKPCLNFLLKKKKMLFKGIVHPKWTFFFSCLAYSPSSCSKHACVSFFCWTQKKIFINIPHITNWLHNRNEILGSYYLKKVFVNYPFKIKRRRGLTTKKNSNIFFSVLTVVISLEVIFSLATIIIVLLLKMAY